MRDDILAGKYENKLAYPTHPAAPEMPATTITVDTNLTLLAEQLKLFLIDAGDYQIKNKEYWVDYREWYQETNRLLALFADDLAKEFGLENHPRKDKLYSAAWDRGHSAGLEEVYICYANLKDILVD